MQTALGKAAFKFLKDAGTPFNKVNTTRQEISH